ncbi:hypothetical protein, partial [Streptomyces scabiei]|uniref:hypothetical protein n=1 Tax=Streptomyces scabiei TaxID=1930 RepID=UPI0029AD48FC
TGVRGPSKGRVGGQPVNEERSLTGHEVVGRFLRCISDDEDVTTALPELTRGPSRRVVRMIEGEVADIRGRMSHMTDP